MLPRRLRQKSCATTTHKFKSSQLYCASSLIPFFPTSSSNQFYSWCENWTQAQPSCFLVGPTASGKSRMIETVSFMMKYHIIEIDCASISGIKELITNAMESTQSHSVGGLLEKGFEIDYANKLSSIVVLEHIDALIEKKEHATKAFLDLILKSKVPLVMTGYENTFVKENEKRIAIINCTLYDKPIKILSSALWFQSLEKTEIRKLEKLLLFTNKDIRKTALQFQVKPDVEDLVDNNSRFYMGMKKRIFQEETENGKREMYSKLTDLLISLDQYDGVFEDYFDDIKDNYWDQLREKEINDYYKLIKNKFSLQNTTQIEFVEISSLVYESCKNPIKKTRRTFYPNLHGETNLTSDDVLKIQKVDFEYK